MLTLTGVSSIEQGGTNNGSLSVNSGTVYYGDGSKLIGLAPGTSGQVLSMGSSFPEWSDVDSTTVTGSYTPTLTVRAGSGGSVSSQVSTGKYVKFPNEKICFVKMDVTFSGTSFTAGTVLDIDLPFNVPASGTREMSLNSYHKDAGGTEFLKTCCFAFNYATFGQKNVFINAPSSFIPTAGGWGNGTVSNLQFIIEGWYTIE